MPTVVAVQKRNQNQWRSIWSDIWAVKLTTVDIASLADAAGANEDITVTGVGLGDHVISLAFGVSTAGMTITANVIAANTVRIRIQNESGGAVDLASTTVTLLIGRPATDLFN